MKDLALRLRMGLVAASALVASPALGPAALWAAGGAEGAGEECAFCVIHTRHAQAIHGATRDVGALPNGVVIHYRSDDPETVAELQTMAFERQQVRLTALGERSPIRMCADCKSRFERTRDARLDLANSVHGVFILITSSDPDVVRKLHAMASEETRGQVARVGGE